MNIDFNNLQMHRNLSKLKVQSFADFQRKLAIILIFMTIEQQIAKAGLHIKPRITVAEIIQ